MHKASVYLRRQKQYLETPITSGDKPEIKSTIVKKWQRIIDTAARIFNVPAGLIMRITESRMEVFLASQTENNPYQQGDSDSLGNGLYCETVIGTRALLAVPDSLQDPVWKDNPDVKLCMISYLGVPIHWPDGETFGTICVLDKQNREYNQDYIDLLEDFRQLIQTDLERELYTDSLEKAENLAALRLKRIHHGIKNQLSILSSLIQMKKEALDDDERNLLDEVDTKIHSMSLLHQRIYESSSFDVSLTEYLESVVRATLEMRNSELRFHCDFRTSLDFDRDQYAEFGLVFSELTVNSIKYGKLKENSTISLITEKADSGSCSGYRIIFRDDGEGYTTDALDGSGRYGIGSLMIESFPIRYNGSFRRYNDNGAVVEFFLCRPVL